MNWGNLAEVPLYEVFTSHLQRNFVYILGEDGDMESEWAKLPLWMEHLEVVVGSSSEPVMEAIQGGQLW